MVDDAIQAEQVPQPACQPDIAEAPQGKHILPVLKDFAL